MTLAAGLAVLIAGAAVAAAPPAGLIVNEVLADPAGSEAHEEFVELRNTGSDEVDLEGWSLGDAEEADRIIDAGDGTRIGPGELAVVVDGSYAGNSTAYDSVRGSARIVTIDDRSFGRGGWSNSTPERVLLRDPAGVVVDSFAYDPADGIPGHSWERRLSGPEWQPSYRTGGTPGRSNSADERPSPAGQVVIEAVPDPFRDTVELLCRVPAAPALLAVTVYDAEGVEIVRLANWEPAGLETRLEWDGRTAEGHPVPPGLFVVLARSSSAGRVASGKRVVVRK